MEKLVGRPIVKQKIRLYVLSTSLSKKISLAKFRRKGKRICLKPEETLRIPQLDRSDHTYGSINAADLISTNSKQLVVGAKREFFIYDLKTGQTVTHVKKHHFGNICNVKSWKNYVIVFTADGPVKIIHLHDHRQKAYVLNHEFAGDYFGGYHAFSRNAELEGNSLIYISKNCKLVYFDLSEITQLKSETISQNLDFGSEHIGETEGGKFFIRLQAREVETSAKIDSLCLFQKFAYFASMDGSVYGFSRRVDHFTRDQPMNPKKLVHFQEDGLDLTALEYYHGNIIAVMFNLSSRRACIKLFNVKTGLRSDAKISQQDRPTQKILMFVKRKMCFGIALNRGIDMHVFGIHRCQIFLFSQNIKLEATHICGILFLDGKLTSHKLLVYGQDNFNKVFKVSL